MKGISAALAASVAFSTSVFAASAPVKRALPAVTVKGNAFYTGNTRFYMRGVDYQPGGSSEIKDPIADVASCKRDVAEFKKLGVNTIRVYSVDNSAASEKAHDQCMQELADAGIYLVLDVNTPKYSINRLEPDVSYNDVYLQSIFATIDAFQKYDNTLAFFSGNEVINADNSTNCAPYVKAVTRDMRQYIGTRGYRKIPVGYSAADVSSNRMEMAAYMNCGTDDERSDFFAFNDYSWCDPSSFTISGWDQKVKNFTDYGLPLFLSEFGCNTNKRQFKEVKSLYSTQTSAVYSGGLVYEYSEEGSNYGLVQINGDTVQENADFTALKNAYASVKNPSGNGGAKSTSVANKCPPYVKGRWDVKSNSLPAMPSGAKKYLTSGAGEGPGLEGAGSQEAGTPSTTFAESGSGAVTTTAASSTKKSAAGSLRVSEFSFAPVLCSIVLAGSALFGASLL